MMFESLNMMIPLQCVDDRSDGDAPPGFSPRNPCPEPVTALRRAGAATWDSSTPRHPSPAREVPEVYVAITDRMGLRK